jgi:hypothetical protein
VHRAVARLAAATTAHRGGLDHGHHARNSALPFPVMGQKGARPFSWWRTPCPASATRPSGPRDLAQASLGGLAATYAHFRWPEVFGGALAMSPSFWVHDDAIEGFLARRPSPAISQLYFDGGKNESKPGPASAGCAAQRARSAQRRATRGGRSWGQARARGEAHAALRFYRMP